jgi:hypothetical protein
MFTKGFNEGAITLQNLNTRLNAIRLDFPKPLTPKFPLVAVFEAMTERDIAIMSVMHEDRKDDWKTIPFRIKQ